MSLRIRTRWPRWGALCLLGLILLLAVSTWALPRWIEGQGVALLSQSLGRPVRLASAQFQPWRMALILNDLEVSGLPAKSPLLSLRRLEGRVSWHSLWHMRPVLESLTVEAPTLRLTRLGAGRYDIDDLIQRFTKPQADAAPASAGMAIYNITLSEGRLELDDVPAASKHTVSELQLDLPFVSTLDADIEVHVQPMLAGRFNGVRFHSEADTQPFAVRRSGRLKLRLDELDLQQYRGYLPSSLPLALSRGMVRADLELRFSQPAGEVPSLSLSGRFGARDVLVEQGKEPLLAWRDLQLDMQDVQPLRRMVKLSALRLDAPELSLKRRADGRLALPGAEGRPGPSGKVNSTASQDAPWHLELNQFDLIEGRVVWKDEAVRPSAQLTLQQLSLSAKQLAWPLRGESLVQLRTDMSADVGQSAGALPAELKAQATIQAQGLSLDAALNKLQLSWLSPYLAAQTPLRLQGLVQGEAQLNWPLEPGSTPVLSVKAVSVKQLQATEPGAATAAPAMQWGELSVDRGELKLAERYVKLGQIRLQQPRLSLHRPMQGPWNVQAWSAPVASPNDPAARVDAASSAAVSVPAWRLRVEGVQLEQGRVAVQDAQSTPIDGAASNGLLLDDIKLAVGPITWPAAPKLSSWPATASLSLAPLNGPNRAPKGRISWKGSVGAEPWRLQGALRTERLPLGVLDAYLDPALGLHLAQAELGVKADVNARLGDDGLHAGLAGELLLADLRLRQARLREGHRMPGEDLLTWQALTLSGLQLALTPGNAPRVQVALASLSDFYARLIINEEGQFNLRDVGAAERHADAASAVAQASDSPASKPSISVGQTRVLNGRVDFSDRYIRPNYSARLSDLNGSLGAFSSENAETAEISLKGRVAGTGLLDIRGRVNPGVSPPVMDLKADATDIELAPLSPYAGKYAGYAIERGKLSTKLQYRIEPGGALQAENQVILNQLTFGERIDSPDATKLPVLLAVALLKDRHGVIDVNLPISGSVNDPQFSVGGLVFKLILNLLGKALTAPFSFLAGGGSEDLSQLEFMPGSTSLAAGSDGSLDRLAKALTERPQLSLTISGMADAGSEAAAIQVLHVEDLLLKERRRELQRLQTAQAQATAEGTLTLSEPERQRLLKQVYAASPITTKPRNAIGMSKDLPPAEMRALLAASHQVTPERLRQLALERGVVVRDALIARGVPNERLFLASPKLLQGEPGDAAKPPHVDLTLAAQ